jgi:DNA-binding protein
MKNLKKRLVRISVGVGVVIVFLVTISLVASWMIDTPAIRSRIQQEISQRAGVAVDFQRLSISFFPAPHLVVKKANVSMPEMFDGTFESLQVFPAIMPLFKGEVGLDKLEIESPNFTLPLPATVRDTDKEGEPLSIEAIENQMRSQLGLLAEKVPNIEINDGSLKFLQDEEPLVTFSDLQVDIDFFFEKFKFTLDCKSNLAESLSLRGSIEKDKLKSKGHFQIEQIKAQVLAEYFFPQEEYGLGEALADIDLQFSAEGLKTLQAELKSTVPSFVLYRGDQQTALKEMQLQGTLQAMEKGITVSLADLSLGSPQLHLAGKLNIDRKSSLVTIDLNGRDIAMQPFRETAESLAGDIAVVKLISVIARGGTINQATLKAQGNSFSEVFDVENMQVAGRFSDGKIQVPDVDIKFDSVTGEVELSDTILHVYNFGAQWGETTVAGISAQFTL